MPKKLQKSLHDYLSKIKIPTPHPPTFPSSKSRIFSGCKHPKTLSFAVYHKEDGSGHDQKVDVAATLSDIDQFLFENFKSLYGRNDDDIKNEYDHHHKENNSHFKGNKKEKSGGVLFDLPLDIGGSNMFFVRTGNLSSPVEESRLSDTTSQDITCSSSTATTNTTTVSESTSNNSDNHYAKALESLPDECIAVLTYSRDPYDEFRQSMDEMIEARLQQHAKVDWDFMQELLHCYLNMNDKKSYKSIISAFVDLVISRGPNSDKSPSSSRRVQVAR